MLVVNETAYDIESALAWIEPCERNTYVIGQYQNVVVHSHDTLNLLNRYDYPGYKRFMETYTDKETGYYASMEARFASDEADLRNGDLSGWIEVRDETNLYRSDSRVLSFMTSRNTPVDFENVRGGRWEYTLTTHNIDAKTGEELALSDVITDIDRLTNLASDALVVKLSSYSIDKMQVRCSN